MIEQYTGEHLIIPEKEVLRYLGYGKNEMDAETKTLYGECLERLEKTVSYRACRLRTTVSVSGDEIILAGEKVKSRALSRHLDGAGEVLLMCATIGPVFDREAERLMHISPARAVIFGAMGTAVIEEWCDELCARWQQELCAEGLYLTSRFSPGYGDLDIGFQPDLLRLTDAGRRSGVTLTQGGMMVPRKSVSAIIGLKKKAAEEDHSSCENCEMEECAFSRTERPRKGGKK